MTNGLFHPYHLGEFTFIFGVSGVIFHLLKFSMKFVTANSLATDWDATFCGVASRAILFVHIP